MNTRSLKLLGMLLGAWLACSGTAHAASGCSVSNITGVNFGGYDSLSPSPVVTAGTLTLCCDGLGPADFVTVDLGLGSSGNASERTLTQGSNKLAYNLYMDRTLTMTWGDGFDGTAHYGPVHPSNGSCSPIPVYGYMPAHQAVHAGSYSDTLTITLSF